MSNTGSEQDSGPSLADISTEAAMEKLESRIVEKILAKMDQQASRKSGETSKQGEGSNQDYICQGKGHKAKGVCVATRWV